MEIRQKLRNFVSKFNGKKENIDELKMLSFFGALRCLSFLQLEKETTINHLKQIHAQLIISHSKSSQIYAKLIERYCAVLSPEGFNYAHLVLTQLHYPHVYPLNVLIRCTRPRSAILVFANWVSRAELNFDDFTYIFVLGACARSSALWEGKQIHARIVKHGFLSNFMIRSTVIHFYARNKDVGSARRMFDEMAIRNNVTWNAMIAGYCSQKERVKEYAHDALLLFRDMLVDVYGVELTATTMVCILSAASQLGVLETGVCVHGYVEKTIYIPENDVFIGTGLVDMYSKCGCLDSAFRVFKRMKEKNVLTWTAMTTGLAIHGKGIEALELLDAMKANGFNPNAVTFTSLLSACCHAGLVEEGLRLFHSMESKFGVIPKIQHYGCIVDLLGRAGHLKEAYEFISGIKVGHDLVWWRSLLNACKVHGDVVMGEKVGKLLLHAQHKPGTFGLADSGEDYIALSNVYASAERWEDVEMVREMMKIKRIEFNRGGSSVYSLSNHL